MPSVGGLSSAVDHQVVGSGSAAVRITREDCDERETLAWYEEGARTTRRRVPKRRGFRRLINVPLQN